MNEKIGLSAFETQQDLNADISFPAGRILIWYNFLIGWDIAEEINLIT